MATTEEVPTIPVPPEEVLEQNLVPAFVILNPINIAAKMEASNRLFVARTLSARGIIPGCPQFTIQQLCELAKRSREAADMSLEGRDQESKLRDQMRFMGCSKTCDVAFRT